MLVFARLVTAALLTGTDVQVDSILNPMVVAWHNQAKEARARVTVNVRVSRSVAVGLARHVPLVSLLHQGLTKRALLSSMSLREMAAARHVCQTVHIVRNGQLRRYAHLACLALGWLHLLMMILTECTARPVLVEFLQTIMTAVARQDLCGTRRSSQGIVARLARPLAILLGCPNCAT